jgi:hypothetical protein
MPTDLVVAQQALIAAIKSSIASTFKDLGRAAFEFDGVDHCHTLVPYFKHSENYTRGVHAGPKHQTTQHTGQK